MRCSWIAALASSMILSVVRIVMAHPPDEHGVHVAELAAEAFTPQVSITVQGEYRLIDANGIPNHATGQFPNRGNPNRIAQQRYHFRVPLHPQANAQATPAERMPFGVAVNGVPFDPGTAEYWRNDPRWRYDALSGKINLGVDASLAHVQPNGAYHYHGLPTGLLEKLGKKGEMLLVGYAADGFPIYNQYGHTDSRDPQSTLKKLRSSYRLKQGQRPGGNDGPGGAYDGTFNQDFEYVAGAGDLDDCNGRVEVTAEYPEGVYHYVLTENFPFIARSFRGTPDDSFRRRGPGRPAGGPNPKGPPPDSPGQLRGTNRS